jgi:hypothetical protein
LAKSDRKKARKYNGNNLLGNQLIACVFFSSPRPDTLKFSSLDTWKLCQHFLSHVARARGGGGGGTSFLLI